MSRHVRYHSLFACIALLAIVAVALFPRIQRCVAYHKIVCTEQAARNLASRPKAVQLQLPDDDIVPLDLGYGQTTLPNRWAAEVTRQQGAAVIQSTDGESMAFLPPFYDSQLSPDGNYTATIETAEVEPVGIADILFMSAAEYEELLQHTIPKSLNRFNQNGIGLFHCENTHGLIRFGPADEPGSIAVEVWANDGEVSQGILIFAKTAENASRLINCVLPQLQYNIRRVPAEELPDGQ